MLSSGDQRVIFHVIESDQPRDSGKSALVTFVLRHFVIKVNSSVSIRDVEEENILSWDQRIEVLRRLGEAHHVERMLTSQCGKTQMAHIDLI